MITSSEFEYSSKALPLRKVFTFARDVSTSSGADAGALSELLELELSDDDWQALSAAALAKTVARKILRINTPVLLERFFQG